MPNGDNRSIVEPVVDLAELFSMPLTALIEADALAAQTFIDFVRRYGFEDHDSKDFDKFGKLKMVSFSYTKLGANGQPQVFNIEVPLILLIPLPALTIDDASMTFEVEIFGIAKRSDEVQRALIEGKIPHHLQPVSRRQKQMRVRMARSTSRKGGATTQEGVRAEAKSRTKMHVDVKLRQSDLPEGILQMLNLTSQSTQDTEVVIPYISLTPETAKTRLTKLGDTLHIQLALLGLDGDEIAHKRVELSQDPDDLFQMNQRVTTDENGRAEFDIVLISAPPKDERVLQMITAKTNVISPAFGAMTAEGSLRIQVSIEE